MKLRPAVGSAACAGQTLAELLAVLSIMAIVLLLAYPGTAPVNVSALDAAVKDVIGALRFAQTDAIRAGAYRVVSFDLTSQTVRIYALDLGQKPPVEDTANPVNHPLDKKAYGLAMNALPGNPGAALSSAGFPFPGSATPLTQITFAADGTPVNVVGPNPPDAKPMSSSGTVVVTYGGTRRTVTVDADTGRVTASS